MYQESATVKGFKGIQVVLTRSQSPTITVAGPPDFFCSVQEWLIDCNMYFSRKVLLSSICLQKTNAMGRQIAISLLVLMAVLLTFSCSRHLSKVAVSNGVSRELAISRKQHIAGIQYELHFTLPAAKNSPVTGKETISFDWKDTKDPVQVDFKAGESQVISVTVNKKPVSVQYVNEHIVIKPKYLKSGRNQLEIQFIAGDQSLNRSDDFLYTLLVPDRARTVFPCFDQPDLKAVFKLLLTIPSGWTAQANGPLIDSVLYDSSTTYHFGSSDTIPTYLFAFVAGKFFKKDSVLERDRMTLLYRETNQEKINGSIPELFQIQRNALNFFGRYTGIAYPFKKFDFAAIPSFQYGGMEHVGNVFYRASSLFLDKGATQNQLNNRAGLLAHETAHMWFGDLVTMEWFDDVWVKEVFAQFMADKFNKGAQSEQNPELKFLVQHFPPAYGVDRTPGANPIHQPLDNLQDAGTIYGDIIYHKAPIMMKQLELLIGEDTLQLGLRKYLKQYAFGNCSWDSLIAILDRESAADLNAWNDTWVNHPGRPVFSYTMEAQEGKIRSFIITQKAEQGNDKTWPQSFKIAFVYPDSIREIPVAMTGSTIELPTVIGQREPLSVLFNSSGEGYGVFPVDTIIFRDYNRLKDPVMRASFCINLYENMLNHSALSPLDLMHFYLTHALSEEQEMTLRLVTRQLSTIFWKFLSPEQRFRIAPLAEERLWQALNSEMFPGKRKVLFNAYRDIALSAPATGRLFDIWKNRLPPEKIILATDDYTELAMALAVRGKMRGDGLAEQLARIENQDDRKRFMFMMPALSDSVSVRDSFFYSLLNKDNRRKEEWVTTALYYLHHPLRAASSIRYLDQSLAMLEEIQATGDIFFPTGWLYATLDNYQDQLAADKVSRYLNGHPKLNPKLRLKVLQAADGLFRAGSILSH